MPYAQWPFALTQANIGQRANAQQNDLGMYWYNSRWYDQLTGRFLQPDTIVPEPGNPGSLNRYSYVLNNPLRYTDPTGHAECVDEECIVRVHPTSGRPLGLKQKYGIILVGPWEADKGWLVQAGMEAMAQQVGSVLGGTEEGHAWVRSVLGDAEYVRWPNRTMPPHPILALTGLHTWWSMLHGQAPIWPGGLQGWRCQQIIS